MKKDIAINGENALQLASKPLTKSTVDLQATRLTDRLISLGVTLKRTQALEGIAAIYGFSDWNRFQAQLSAPIKDINKVASTQKRTQPSKNPVDHQVLLMRPGEGKSLAILYALVDAIEKNNGIRLVIDCLDNGSGYDRLPESIKEKVLHLPFYFNNEDDFDTLSSRIEGSLGSINGIYIGLGCPGNELFRSQVFCALVDRIFSIWPQSVLDQINVVMVDDFSRMDDKCSSIFDVALNQFHLNGTQIILSSMFPFTGTTIHHQFGHPFLRKFKLIASDFYVEKLNTTDAAMSFRSLQKVMSPVRMGSEVDGVCDIVEIAKFSTQLAKSNAIKDQIFTNFTTDLSRICSLLSSLINGSSYERVEMILSRVLSGLLEKRDKASKDIFNRYIEDLRNRKTESDYAQLYDRVKIEYPELELTPSVIIDCLKSDESLGAGVEIIINQKMISVLDRLKFVLEFNRPSDLMKSTMRKMTNLS